MIKINIVGDFYSPSLDKIKFGNQLMDLLNDGNLNIVNFEGPISSKNAMAIPKSGPNICQDVKAPQFLKEKGFNVFSLANNHSLDFGEDALDATIASFKDKTIVGAGTWDDAYQVKYCDVEDKRIGFLALVQYEFGVLGERPYSKNKKGSAWIGHPCVDEMIKQARTQCDVLIILPHAGLEYFTLPLPELRTLYRHFVDMGADAVIASHPHVPQPYEVYKGKPIAYSLGNFCFDEDCDKPLWNVGLLAQLIVDNVGVGMKLKVLLFDKDKRAVDVLNDEKVEAQLSECQKTFSVETDYLDAVNYHCLSLEPYYKMLLEMSGYRKMSIKRCLGFIKRWLLGQITTSDDTHFINCIRCEPHKWVLSRIYELKR